jgi:hypothetical protein
MTWKDEIKKEDNKYDMNKLSPKRIVDSNIAEQILTLHQDLQRLGTVILDSAVELHNENIGPNSKPIDVSPDELIKLLHRYQLAMRGYVQYFAEYE